MVSKINEWVKHIWERHNYITILDIVNIKKHWHFLYECDCWKIKTWQCYDVLNNKIMSCGCMMNKLIDERCRLKHWMSNDRFYKIYHDAKKRCVNNKVHSYKNYWGRWIKMEWGMFEDFKKDMYDSYLEHIKRYWEDETTIERIDVNWNYCKENCRWATMKEQAQNKQNTIRIDWKTLWEIAKETWLSVCGVYSRYRRRANIYAPRKTNQFKSI